MIDPKTFYRELDDILATIRIEKSGEKFFSSILNKLEDQFATRLYFCNSRIYEKRGNDFLLIEKIPQAKPDYFAAKINIDSAPVQLVSQNRSYIFDIPEYNALFNKEKNGNTVAAIWVHDPENQWLFVFELLEGWEREEISLFLNSVRTSLNYRLFADMMGGRLEQAVQIQKSLLPRKPLQIEGYEIFGCSQPAEVVGGDFYDYFEYEDGIFGISLGDASGHGFPAALLVRDVVIGLRMGLARELRLVHTLQKLNKVIQRSTYSTNFVSLFVGEFENDGHLFYVNAGHPAPFIVKENSVVDLPATGITLGFMPEIELQRAYARMLENSVLILYSDGIIERENETTEQFGLERFKNLIIKHQRKSAQELLKIIFDEAYIFGNRAKWSDDVTVVVIKKK